MIVYGLLRLALFGLHAFFFPALNRFPKNTLPTIKTCHLFGSIMLVGPGVISLD